MSGISIFGTILFAPIHTEEDKLAHCVRLDCITFYFILHYTCLFYIYRSMVITFQFLK